MVKSYLSLDTLKLGFINETAFIKKNMFLFTLCFNQQYILPINKIITYCFMKKMFEK